MHVSILMSVYNGERYLRSAILSLLNQTERDFEFLIVDDASTDSTPSLLCEFAHTDARIRILTNAKNIGLTRSLNRALDEVHGTYIARMDADDVALPTRLEKQLRYLEEHPQVGLVGCAYDFIDEGGSIIGHKLPPTRDSQLKHALIKYNPFLHSSVLLRTDLLRHAGGYNASFRRAQDYELWMRLSRVTQLANLSDTLMQKRFTTHMISYTSEKEQIRSALRVRTNAIKQGWYPLWKSIYLVKPWLATVFPAFLVRFIRIHVFRQTMYKRAV